MVKEEKMASKKKRPGNQSIQELGKFFFMMIAFNFSLMSF